MQKKLPAYKHIAKEIFDNEESLLPARIHGYLCGVICGARNKGDQLKFQLVYDYINEEGISLKASKELLAKLMVLSFQQLEDEEHNFQLLLPNDAEDIHFRIKTLSKWCESFLSGLGFSGFEIKEVERTDIKEALNDIAKIAQIKGDEENTDNDSEIAFNELVEYVRVAVMLIYR